MYLLLIPPVPHPCTRPFPMWLQHTPTSTASSLPKLLSPASEDTDEHI